jgi:hypothetical protein
LELNPLLGEATLLFASFQEGSEVQPASYPVGTGDSFDEGGCEEGMEIYLSIPTYTAKVWCLIKHMNNIPFTQYFFIPILSSISLCSFSTYLPIPASRFVERL